MREPDHICFAGRAREKREAAERAATEEARAAHAQLCGQYSDLTTTRQEASNGPNEGLDQALFQTQAGGRQARRRLLFLACFPVLPVVAADAAPTAFTSSAQLSGGLPLSSIDLNIA